MKRKPSRGRPPLAKDVIRVSISIDKKLWDSATKVAERIGVPTSAYVRSSLQSAVDSDLAVIARSLRKS